MLVAIFTKVAVRAADLEPIPIKLPLPVTIIRHSPDVPQMSVHFEKPAGRPRPPFMAPRGVQNLSFKKKVTSSDRSPLFGTLDMVTDGDKENQKENYLILRRHRKPQWVQIDLEKKAKLYAIVVWHVHTDNRVYKDVVVQVADNPDFTQNVRTVFNNDFDNTSELGVGTDKEYSESYEGRLIDTKGVEGRYVRAYSWGSSEGSLNEYTEVEVWGLPAE